MKTKILFAFVCILLALWAGTVLAQSENEAINLAKEAKSILDSAKSKEDYQRASQKYEEALQISERFKSDKWTAICAYQLGSIQFNLGQNQKSIEYYEKSLDVSQKSGEVRLEGSALGGIGAVYNSLSQYQKALEYHEKCLAIMRKIGDVNNEGAVLDNIGQTYNSLSQYQKALEYFEQSLTIRRKIGDIKGQGTTLNNIASVYRSWGQNQKALEYYEQSLEIKRKVGDVNGEANILNNVGSYYWSLSQYQKALDHYEKSLEMRRRIGDLEGEGTTLNNMGTVYSPLGHDQKAFECYEKSLAIMRSIGKSKGEATALDNIGGIYKDRHQYQKALDHYEKSLEMRRRIGDLEGEGITLNNMGTAYYQWGQYQKAFEYLNKSLAIIRKIGNVKDEAALLKNMAQLLQQVSRNEEAITYAREALAISKKVGFPTASINQTIANIYLDQGNVEAAEPYVKKSGDPMTLGRMCLLKSEYVDAKQHYEKLYKVVTNKENSQALFVAVTGLGKVNEATKDLKKAEEFYARGVTLVEDHRTTILPSDRSNFYEFKAGGFFRSGPAKGLVRVRIKLNRPAEAIAPCEMTRARAFADHLARTSSTGAAEVPEHILGKEQSLVIRLAALKKALTQTDKEKQSEKYKSISIEVKRANAELSDFVNTLWKDYPAYAAVKYPRPPSLKDSALRPEECAVILDASTDGVGVILIRNKAVSKAFYLNIKLTDLERDVMRFREPFEKLRLKDYDPELAKALYDKLLRPVLVDVPQGAPLIIMPDGILAMLPFEALVTGGEAKWKKTGNGLDYPEGLTFLGDEHPISYYQSITALTLVRTIGNREKPKDSLLVLADPVFNMKDQRAQQASETRLSQKEKEYNIQRMAAIEDSVGPLFPQLPETGKLADKLVAMYGTNCLAIKGLKADRLDFLSQIAPRMDQYGKVVFATHGVMGNKVPGVMEPFLALTMVPPGTDGFLKMSDILSLKMNSDIVALTACETGLGKDVSGEGVMSMGRAFQYAGARSVLMSLWSVADVSSVKLTESFFQHLKLGKSKLESLKLAREEIRKQGFEHPFFWSAFILVGETS